MASSAPARRGVGLMALTSLAIAALVPIGRTSSPPPTFAASPSSSVPTSSSAPTPAPAPALSWHACGFQFNCARLSVPLDYANPKGAKVHLALIELPATGPHVLGDIITNPGGPGGSGLQFLEEAAGSFPASLRKSFNIVSFDPRGVGESSPVHCANAAGIRSLVAANPDPTTAAQVASVVAATKAYVRSCFAHTPRKLLEHVSTLDTARDLDVLRAALGQPKLDYLGFSYGTYLGELYAEHFPTHVGHMVLDGVVDPALSMAALDKQQAQGFAYDLNSFFKWCGTNLTCRQYLPNGARAAYEQLMSGLENGTALYGVLPPGQGGRQQVTVGVASLGVISALYSKSDWSYLALALSEALHYNGALLLSLAYQYAGMQSDGHFSNEMAAETAISCLDQHYPTTVATYQKLAARLDRQVQYFGGDVAWSSISCALWPIVSHVYPAPVRVHGAPTILLVGSTGDPATPYEWAQAVTRQIGNARLLTRNGQGHTGYLNSTCVQRWVDGFFQTGKLPPSGTVCASGT